MNYPKENYYWVMFWDLDKRPFPAEDVALDWLHSLTERLGEIFRVKAFSSRKGKYIDDLRDLFETERWNTYCVTIDECEHGGFADAVKDVFQGTATITQYLFDGHIAGYILVSLLKPLRSLTKKLKKHGKDIVTIKAIPTLGHLHERKPGPHWPQTTIAPSAVAVPSSSTNPAIAASTAKIPYRNPFNVRHATHTSSSHINLGDDSGCSARCPKAVRPPGPYTRRHPLGPPPVDSPPRNMAVAVPTPGHHSYNIPQAPRAFRAVPHARPAPDSSPIRGPYARNAAAGLAPLGRSDGPRPPVVVAASSLPPRNPPVAIGTVAPGHSDHSYNIPQAPRAFRAVPNARPAPYSSPIRGSYARHAATGLAPGPSDGPKHPVVVAASSIAPRSPPVAVREAPRRSDVRRPPVVIVPSSLPPRNPPVAVGTVAPVHSDVRRPPVVVAASSLPPRSPSVAFSTRTEPTRASVGPAAHTPAPTSTLAPVPRSSQSSRSATPRTPVNSVRAASDSKSQTSPKASVTGAVLKPTSTIPNVVIQEKRTVSDPAVVQPIRQGTFSTPGRPPAPRSWPPPMIISVMTEAQWEEKQALAAAAKSSSRDSPSKASVEQERMVVDDEGYLSYTDGESGPATPPIPQVSPPRVSRKYISKAKRERFNSRQVPQAREASESDSDDDDDEPPPAKRQRSNTRQDPKAREDSDCESDDDDPPQAKRKRSSSPHSAKAREKSDCDSDDDDPPPAKRKRSTSRHNAKARKRSNSNSVNKPPSTRRKRPTKRRRRSNSESVSEYLPDTSDSEFNDPIPERPKLPRRWVVQKAINIAASTAPLKKPVRFSPREGVVEADRGRKNGAVEAPRSGATEGASSTVKESGTPRAKDSDGTSSSDSGSQVDETDGDKVPNPRFHGRSRPSKIIVFRQYKRGRTPRDSNAPAPITPQAGVQRREFKALAVPPKSYHHINIPEVPDDSSDSSDSDA